MPAAFVLEVLRRSPGRRLRGLSGLFPVATVAATADSLPMQRLIDPELLDHLPSSDPAAIRSRDELRLINGIMGNHRWLLRRVRALIRPGWRVLELGAGDGALCRGLHEAGICAVGRLTAIDLAPRPAGLHPDVTWLRRSIFETTPLPQAEIVVANLFLHHFEEEQLATLGQNLSASARVVLACEPARISFHLAQGAVLAALGGFNEVTCHDMLTSIRAGFVRDELPHALRLQDWQCCVSTTLLGAYHMDAVRSVDF